MTFIGAWDRAEDVLYGLIQQWTGTSDGKDAFNDDDYPRINAYAFIVTGGPEQAQNFQTGIPSCSFMAGGELTGYYIKRSDAKTIASDIIEHMPLSTARSASSTPQNIQDFSVLAFPDTRRTTIPTPTDDSVLVWRLHMTFRVVFNGAQA
ncbi:MAG: hypothetical protein ACTSX8_01630 [Alphaproteobacteria bacterium]